MSNAILQSIIFFLRDSVRINNVAIIVNVAYSYPLCNGAFVNPCPMLIIRPDPSNNPEFI